MHLPPIARTKVAIVHDYLTQRGGAERVVLAMLAAFPEATLHTSVYEPSTTFPEFGRYNVRTLWTDRIDALRHDHRRGLPLYPFAFSSHTVDAEVVLCSSSGFAHGVGTTGRKVVYCYTPPRWLYDEADNYLAGWSAPVRAGARVLGGALRAWDRRAARSADVTLTSTSAVRNRIARAYGIGAELLPPPVTIVAGGEQRPVPGVEPGYLLSVGRLLAYKNIDAVVASMSLVPDSRLVVVGTGPEQARLQATAGANVLLLGEVDDTELRWLYANCAGVVSAAYEDYGLTPLEAATHGRPSAVLRRGGFPDTVVDGATGVFFEEPTPAAVAGATTRLLSRSWDRPKLAAHAADFSEEAFITRLRAAVYGTEPTPAVVTEDGSR